MSTKSNNGLPGLFVIATLFTFKYENLSAALTNVLVFPLEEIKITKSFIPIQLLINIKELEEKNEQLKDQVQKLHGKLF
ncbi:hypothetical protein [Gracilibacillus timonensis]|uniref:hypothetical protein n=1 Tax=Gracilibacillus timonensis TaxID=1816696 RepID=UPI00082664F3|nr:hypothetical protein [Gracilibacillus timonensis]